MRRALVTMMVVAGLLGLVAATPAEAEPDVDRRLYVMSQYKPHKLRIFDIDNGHRLIREIPLPNLKGSISGMAATAVKDRIYISSSGVRNGPGQLTAVHLETGRVLGTRNYRPGVDAVCITPDGQRLYLSSGEHSPSTYFFWLSPNGKILGRHDVGATNTHNTVCGHGSQYAYLASIRSPWLTMVNAKTNERVRRIGPFSDGIRPFTVNGTQTLAFVNVNRQIGFEVGDIRTGEMLYRVDTPGFPYDGSILNPSHGVAITPDETEAWIADSQHHYLHVFDITGLPGTKPTYKTSIRVAGGPAWITFSLEGDFAYSSSGQVFDTGTHREVARYINRSTKVLEVQYVNGEAVRAASRHGLGYVGAP